MSYDILAFEPSAVTDSDFDEWWEQQAEWSEDHSYDDVAVSTPALAAFYAAIIKAFPPLNGPDAPPDAAIESDDQLEERLTDYSVGETVIYAAFAWSQAAAARATFLNLASEHGVAVALVSDDSKIIRPKPARKRRCPFGGK